MAKLKVKMYDLPDGTFPVQDFIDSLDAKMQAKVLRSVKLLEENGTDLRLPYSAYLTSSLTAGRQF